MQLIQNPAGNIRQRPPKVSVTALPSRVPPPDHHWIQLAKKQCTVLSIMLMESDHVKTEP